MQTHDQEQPQGEREGDADGPTAALQPAVDPEAEARRNRMRELGKRGGKRSGEARRAAAAKRAEAGSTDEDGLGSGSVVSVDPAAPRAVLRSIAADERAPASARVQAARALQEVDSAGHSSDPAVARFLAARDALAQLDPHERLAYLRDAIPAAEVLKL